MKCIVHIVSCLLCGLIFGSAFAGTQSRVVPIEYQSPLPGARFVTPQTSIIIRPAASVNPVTLKPNLFSVSGSFSGKHSGNLILANDGRTLLFMPATQFTIGESVTVEIGQGLQTTDGRNIATTRFSFFISKHIVPENSIDWNAVLDIEGLGRKTTARPFASSAGEQTIVRRDTLPPDFPTLQSTIYGTPSPGRIFLADVALTGMSASYLMILNDAGTPVFYRKTHGSAFDFKMQPNGLLTYCDLFTRTFYALDATYAVVDSFRCGYGYPTDLHDLRILQNGHAVLMAYDPQIVDMSQIVPGGDTAAVVIGLIVQELDLNKNIVFHWRSWDHFQITDATHEDLTAHQIDYVHGNAIDIDTDGNFILSSRHMDELTKISRQTGNVIWRWGGKNNQFALTNDMIGFSHQHAVRRIENGNITLFDNGNFHTPQFSRAIEYTVNESTRTATIVWQYRNTPDIYGRALGYVQRLPSGNTLIGWGAAVPSVMEIRPDGSKVSELSIVNAGRFSYRAYRFVWNPTSAIEPQTVPMSMSLSQNYPNPFNPATTIKFSIAAAGFVRLSVYDVLGREVAKLVNEQLPAGNYSTSFDASQFSSGTYFYRLQSGDAVQTKKLLVVK